MDSNFKLTYGHQPVIAPPLKLNPPDHLLRLRMPRGLFGINRSRDDEDQANILGPF